MCGPYDGRARLKHLSTEDLEMLFASTLVLIPLAGVLALFPLLLVIQEPDAVAAWRRHRARRAGLAARRQESLGTASLIT